MQAAGIWMILSMCACESLLDVDSSTTLGSEDHYTAPGELYGAFIGIAGSFQKVAEQTIILSELKGDLLEPTAAAPKEFWNIYTYKADRNTPWTSMGRYYDIVINCNDFLRRATKFNREYPGGLPEKIYKGMISNAVRYKAWSLFTIAKFSGEATIYDVNVDSDDASGMITMKLDDLIHFLIDYLKNGEEGIDGFQSLSWKDLLNDQNVQWEGCRLEGNVLMAEFNLWLGNYEEAIYYYKQMITTPIHDLIYAGPSWKQTFTAEPAELPTRVITVAPFNAGQGQQHKLRYYFSNISPNVYYLAPTQKTIDLFESQTLEGFLKGDQYRGAGITYDYENGKPVVFKYSLKPGIDAYTSDAHIQIYRSAEMHLGLAEAYCFMGRYEEALTFLDNGLKAYKNVDRFSPPFEDYDFALQNNAGVRGHVLIVPIDRDHFFDGCVSRTDSVVTLASKIADEYTLEFAYEGKRWFTLMRMAMHLNNPSFLSGKVAEKFPAGEREAYKALLNNKENWYIKEK